MTQQPIPSSDVTSDDRLWALLSWIFWPVAIVMLFMDDKKARPFIKYNVILGLAFTVILYIVGTITAGCLLVVGYIYVIVLAIQSYQGKWVVVPFLSDFIKKQGWV